MSVKKITVPDIGTVSLHKRKGASGIRLSISHDGEVRVSMPYWVPFATGIAFVMSKKAWIMSKLVEPVVIQDGQRIGKSHHVTFIREDDRHSVATRITNSGEIRVFIPEALPTDSAEVQKMTQKACIRALRQQAEQLLPQRLETLATQHGFTYNEVSIKQLKSRWGSCSDQKDIALNLFLMQLPWHLIDYVLLHELMHTRIMAHGPRFWAELHAYVPHLATVRKHMRSYRPVLLPAA